LSFASELTAFCEELAEKGIHRLLVVEGKRLIDGERRVAGPGAQ
jgi:hypothetical protein